jgi:hypothetical protein
MISINAISCSAMQNDDDNTQCNPYSAEASDFAEASSDKSKGKQKTISTLLKLVHRNKPVEAKKSKDFYIKHINNFNQHTNELYNAINLANAGHYTVHPAMNIRVAIITDDLIPLKYKMRNLLQCIETYNLYRINYSGQNSQNPEKSPRIKIIDSIIDTCKDCAIFLDAQKIGHYQCLINHIAYFSVKKGHDKTIAYEDSWIHQHDPDILDALKTISSDAQTLATLLNEETLNEEQLIEWKNHVKYIQQSTTDNGQEVDSLHHENSEENEECCVI